MYEVAKHFYEKFLPAIVRAAKSKDATAEAKWEARVAELLARPEHVWLQGLTPAEAEALRKSYEQRYDQ
jgi:hypothetical protein